jgi:hypothetical protein
MRGKTMDTNITMNLALNIAQDYKGKYNLSGVIRDNLERSIRYYSEFDGATGAVWLVLVSITQILLLAYNEYNIVISDEKAAVEYIIDPNGHVFCPHLETMIEEEFDEIGNDEDD